jgi:hypothetical protein|tara:strand:+ start:303 stop:602 length:300 start_codon:yes stop_codon:yes gene_type:complete
MTEYDLNSNGKIDPDERELMLEDRRLRMEDADHKRDAQLKMTWFALFGLLIYPLGIVAADLIGYDTTGQLLADIAPTYFIAISGLVAAFFGFSALGSKR